MILLIASLLLSLVSGASLPLLLMTSSVVGTPQTQPIAAIEDAPLAPASEPPVANGTTRFRGGAYFTVDYPTSFTAIPGIGGEGDAEKLVDSASFRSPDGRVVFYVFSPIWNGEPTDFSPPEGTPIVTETAGDHVVRRATWKMPDGMTRAFEDTEFPEYNTRHTFGIAYRDQASYDQWKPAYLAFKQSLQQFAD